MKRGIAISIIYFVALFLFNGCFSSQEENELNIILQIAEDEVVRDLSNDSSDPIFNQAITLALERQKLNQRGFVELFGEAFSEIYPDGHLAALFSTPELMSRVDFNSTNEDVLIVITEEINRAIDNSYYVLMSRIENFGIPKKNRNLEIIDDKIYLTIKSQPDDPENIYINRLRKLFTTRGEIGFWETYENSEIFPYIQNANDNLRELLANEPDQEGIQAYIAEEVTSAGEVDTEDQPLSLLEQITEDQPLSLLEQITEDQPLSLLEQITDDGFYSDSTALIIEDFVKENPLFGILQPNTTREGQFVPGSTVGFSHYRDTAKVMEYLTRTEIRALFPRDVMFLWDIAPMDMEGQYFSLYSLRQSTRDNRPPLDGSVVTSASLVSGGAITIRMNAEGARIWARLTRENINKAIAIVLDGYVVSAPTVYDEIPDGRSTISGNFDIDDAQFLANIMNSIGGRGMLYKLYIVNEQITKQN